MTATLESQLSAYLGEQRWFAGKDRDFSVLGVHSMSWLSTEDPWVRVELVSVAYADGDPRSETYQVPLAYLLEADPDLGHALVGPVEHPDLGAVVAYDATFVGAFAELLLRGFSDHRREPDLAFEVLDSAELPDPGVAGTVLSAEQSNTSLVYGDDALLKLFRRIGDGGNPDIEIHQALTRTGNDHVAPLLGWIEAQWRAPDGAAQHGHLGMLQAYLRTATDGWDIALSSVRDLFVEEDLHPEEVGGDFAAEAERLGATTADVHRDLAELFGVVTVSEPQRRELALAMASRLEAAVTTAPQLETYAPSLRRSFAALAELDDVITAQRIHGDLHLGQTLRTVKGWKIIDFEGEPAKSLADRVTPASPLRDVAGMLRSFDYAAGATLHQFGYGDQLRYRGDEWTQRNRAAFLTGYRDVAGDDPEQHRVLLRAYETDKAVYEVVYEARHRPTWLTIPLHAVERLARED